MRFSSCIAARGTPSDDGPVAEQVVLMTIHIAKGLGVAGRVHRGARGRAVSVAAPGREESERGRRRSKKSAPAVGGDVRDRTRARERGLVMSYYARVRRIWGKPVEQGPSRFLFEDVPAGCLAAPRSRGLALPRGPRIADGNCS